MTFTKGNQIYRRAKFFPEFKGSAIVTLKCQECSNEVTRKMEDLRKALINKRKVLCPPCLKTINEKNYAGLKKVYETKQVAKKYYGVEDKFCYQHQKWHGSYWRNCRVKKGT